MACTWKSLRVIAFALSLSYVLLSYHLLSKAKRHILRAPLHGGGLLSPPKLHLKRSNQSIDFQKADLCIIIGIFSRASEYKLRQWQRKRFASFHTDKRQNIQLRFPVAYNRQDQSLNELLYDEQHQYGDLMFLPMAENYKWLTAQTFEFLRTSLRLWDHSNHNHCKRGRYFVKADSDVVISYTRLVHMMYEMPNDSVYTGQMQPDTPMHEQWMRKAGAYSLSYLPIWAVGQFYALSIDIVRKLVRDDVVRTVFKADEGYVFPAEDRAIGLALKRAQLPVEHFLHMRGLYLFCEVRSLLNCDRLSEFTAIGVGFGLSGSDADNQSTKLKLLAEVSFMEKSCRASLKKRNLDTHATGFVAVTEAFMHPQDPQQYFFEGCPKLTGLGTMMKKQFNDESKQIQIEFNENPKTARTCAEAAYWLNYPEMKGVDSQSAREHFLSTGFRTSDVSYYCPRECFDTNCTSCDREKAYMASYPDIANAVQEGSLTNVTDHFVSHGKREGRVFSCFPRHQEAGVGSTHGCETVFRKFIQSTGPVVSKWPVFGHNRGMSQNALVFCEGRHHEWTDYALRVFRRFTGPDWLFYLIGPPDVTAVWEQEYSGLQIQIVTLPAEFGDLSNYPFDVNRLLLSSFLWNETIQRENVLVVQSDSLLLRHGIEDFFDFDYVGSPVFPESFPDMNWRLLCAKHLHCGGNGGLSFRRRSSILHVLETCNIPRDSMDEDQWFSGCMAEAKMSLPHPIIANRFSAGSTCHVDSPIGAHKLWQNCKESTCMEALIESQLFADIYGEDYQSTSSCSEGNAYYLHKNQDVANSFDNGFEHYQKHGKSEGRRWVCFDAIETPHQVETPSDGVPMEWLHQAGIATA